MIRPVCQHGKGEEKPSMRGWVFCCGPHFEEAVVKNTAELQAKLAAALAKVQTLESDVHDLKAIPGISAMRCLCGRLRGKGHRCPGCGI